MTYDYDKFINNPNVNPEYQYYYEQKKYLIPDSAIAINENPLWHDHADESPYYCTVKNLNISNLGSEDSNIELTIEKEESGVTHTINISYIGVYSFDFGAEGSDCFYNNLIWRYSIFFHSTDHYEHEIQGKMFKHQIEWLGKRYWTIVARKMEATWKSS